MKTGSLRLAAGTSCDAFLFLWLSGLADGLAPKRWRYAALRPRLAPNGLGPPIPAICGGDSAQSGGMLTTPQAETHTVLT